MGDAADARLLSRPFLALAAATLAFFVAAGIVLPIAPQFAEEALGADRIGVGVSIASFSVAVLAGVASVLLLARRSSLQVTVPAPTG